MLVEEGKIRIIARGSSSTVALSCDHADALGFLMSEDLEGLIPTAVIDGDDFGDRPCPLATGDDARPRRLRITSRERAFRP